MERIKQGYSQNTVRIKPEYGRKQTAGLERSGRDRCVKDGMESCPAENERDHSLPGGIFVCRSLTEQLS